MICLFIHKIHSFYQHFIFLPTPGIDLGMRTQEVPSPLGTGLLTFERSLTSLCTYITPIITSLVSFLVCYSKKESPVGLVHHRPGQMFSVILSQKDVTHTAWMGNGKCAKVKTAYLSRHLLQEFYKCCFDYCSLFCFLKQNLGVFDLCSIT